MITHRYSAKIGALIGETGVYSGSIMKIPSYSNFTIGRDPAECNLVISSDCKNVSRVHCHVEYDVINNCYLIRDCSSNGTVIKEANGNKTLLKHQTAKATSGSIILVGDEKNSFKLF